MDKDRFPLGNNHDDEEPESTTINPLMPRTPDFFSNFIAERVNRTTETDKSDEDDDEDNPKKSSKKKNRFTGLLKQVVPNTVVPEQPIRNPAEVIDTLPDADQENSPRTSKTLEPDRVPSPPPEMFDETQTQERREEHMEPEPDSSFTHETPLTPESVEEVVTPYNVPPVPPPLVSPRPAANESGPRSARITETQPITGLSAEERLIIERHRSGGAVLAFLGAEALSRRRDRKLARAIKESAKSSQESLSALRSRQASEAEKLTQQANIQRTQSERLKNHIQRVERHVEQRAKIIPDNHETVVGSAMVTGAREVMHMSEPENSQKPISSEKQQFDVSDKHPVSTAELQLDRLTPAVSIETVLAAKQAELDDNLKEQNHSERPSRASRFETLSDRQSHQVAASGQGRDAQMYAGTQIITNSQQNSSTQPVYKDPAQNHSLTQTLSSHSQSIQYGVGGAILLMAIGFIVYVLR